MNDIKIYELEKRTPEILAELTAVWEQSVRATHNFLSEREIQEIKKYVPSALSNAEHLIVSEKDKNIVAFAGTEKGKLEMLFLLPCERGKGLGKRLLQYGINNYGIITLTVNEQNPQAVGFYRHMGFEIYKRTDNDEEANPYPLLYMRLI